MSGNRLAAGFKKITWFTGTVNLDLGGGKIKRLNISPIWFTSLDWGLTGA